MSWSGLNKREFPRINLSCDISIHDGDVPIKAKTENLGPGGLCALLERELEKLSSVHLSLELEPNTPPVRSHARIVWIVKSKELGSKKVSYDTGFEFINISDADRLRIMHVVGPIKN